MNPMKLVPHSVRDPELFKRSSKSEVSYDLTAAREVSHFR